MKLYLVTIATVLAGTSVLAADAPKQSGQQLLTTKLTASGQAIVPPAGPLQVTATLAEIGPGESTPLHKHPYLRYDYVLEGTLSVTNFDTGKTDVVTAGQFVVDPVGQWHQGKSLGGKRVRLLIIDQTPIGKSNLILKEAPK